MDIDVPVWKETSHIVYLSARASNGKTTVRIGCSTSSCAWSLCSDKVHGVSCIKECKRCSAHVKAGIEGVAVMSRLWLWLQCVSGGSIWITRLLRGFRKGNVKRNNHLSTPLATPTLICPFAALSRTNALYHLLESLTVIRDVSKSIYGLKTWWPRPLCSVQACLTRFVTFALSCMEGDGMPVLM